MLVISNIVERDIIQQRTRARLEVARNRGRIGGRPAIDEKVKEKVRVLFEAGESAKDIARVAVHCFIKLSTRFQKTHNIKRLNNRIKKNSVFKTNNKKSG